MFLRVRLGQYRIGLRIEQLPHSIIVRFLFSKVADTAGVLNKFANTNQQVLFMDFDDRANIYEIKERIYQMQRKFNLGDIFIMKSSENHFIGICFDLCYAWEIKQMMNYISDITDYRFTYVMSRDGYNALRFTPKIIDNTMHRIIKLYDISYGFNTERMKHTGLMSLFFDKFGFPNISTYKNADQSTESDLYIRRYETINW